MTRVILVYYGTVTDGAGERLQRVIEELVPEAELEVWGVLSTERLGSLPQDFASPWAT